MKIIKIKDCQHCPFVGTTDDWCTNTGRDFQGHEGFPDWCPLEDAPEPIKSVDEYHRKMKGIEMFPEDGVRCRINFYSTPEDEG